MPTASACLAEDEERRAKAEPIGSRPVPGQRQTMPPTTARTVKPLLTHRFGMPLDRFSIWPRAAVPLQADDLEMANVARRSNGQTAELNKKGASVKWRPKYGGMSGGLSPTTE